MIIENLYDFARPVSSPNMFFGRSALLDSLVRRLSSPRIDSFPIYGGRRAGKTSLMRMLEYALNARVKQSADVLIIPIYLDIQFLAPTSPGDFFNQVVRRLETWWAELFQDEIHLGEVRAEDPAPSFVEIFKKFYQKKSPDFSGIKLVILIDETDKLQRPDWARDLDDNLRSLLSNQPGVTGNLSLAMAGGTDFYSDMVTERGASPLRNVMSEDILLHPASPEEMLRLVDEPTGGKLPRKAAAEVVRQAGGSLFLGQYLMRYLCDMDIETVDVAAVQEIAEVFTDRRHDFDDWWKALGEEACALYEVLAQSPSPVPSIEIARALGVKQMHTRRLLDRLTFHQLVVRQEDGYTWSGKMFHAWFLENIQARVQQTRGVSVSTKKEAGMISILFLSADPTDASRLRLGEELRELQEKLQLAKLREQYKLNQRMSVRPVDISQALLDLEPQIVHFSGHGKSTGELYFENQLGQAQAVDPDALSALFEQFADQVNCVILNACFSEVQAQAIARYINYVIGMSNSISDRAAIAFTIGFYQAIGAGRTVEDAYKLGCIQLRLQGIPEQLTPVLIKKA